MELTKSDVVIVGAGVAGCAAAKAFADQGRRVVVIERQLSQNDRFVGELLQPGGVQALERLGLEDCLEGIEATPFIGVQFYWNTDQETSFRYSPVPNKDGSPGKKPIGKTFHNCRLVDQMRKRIAKHENIELIEGRVVEIIRDGKTGVATGVACVSKELGTKVISINNTKTVENGQLLTIKCSTMVTLCSSQTEPHLTFAHSSCLTSPSLHHDIGA